MWSPERHQTARWLDQVGTQTHRDIYTQTHRDIHTQTHRNVHTQTHRDEHTQTHRDVHTQTRRDVHTDTHRDLGLHTKRTLTQTLTQTPAQTLAQTLTHKRKPIQTYPHRHVMAHNTLAFQRTYQKHTATRHSTKQTSAAGFCLVFAIDNNPT